MRRFLSILAALPLVLLLTACPEENKADKAQREATDQIVAEAQAKVGMPDIVNFTERQLVIDLYELRDRPNLATFTYIIDLNGGLHCLGHSIGFGVPGSVQSTNPEKLINPNTTNSDSNTMPQAEPNGLFMPESMDATWIAMIDPRTGDINPTYVEPTVIVSMYEFPQAATPCLEIQAKAK